MPAYDRTGLVWIPLDAPDALPRIERKIAALEARLAAEPANRILAMQRGKRRAQLKQLQAGAAKLRGEVK